MSKYHILPIANEDLDINSDDFFERLISDNDNTNVKTIICYKIIEGKRCPYGFNCMYAHSLNAQKVDESRKKAYDIILQNNDLSDINLIDNTDLYTNLITLTKLCPNCVKQTCPGGYNCKWGVIKKSYQVCYTDLRYGNCSDMKCKLIHLTKRNLVSFQKQKIDNSSIFIKQKYTSSEISHAILLTSDYFKDNSKISESSDEITSDERNQTISFLNSDINDSDSESIFID